MWNGRILKIIPPVLFLFCLLEIFELVLAINDLNKTEKIEYQLRQNLEMIETITNLANEHLKGMELKHYKKKR